MLYCIISYLNIFFNEICVPSAEEQPMRKTSFIVAYAFFTFFFFISEFIYISISKKNTLRAGTLLNAYAVITSNAASTIALIYAFVSPTLEPLVTLILLKILQFIFSFAQIFFLKFSIFFIFNMIIQSTQFMLLTIHYPTLRSNSAWTYYKITGANTAICKAYKVRQSMRSARNMLYFFEAAFIIILFDFIYIVFRRKIIYYSLILGIFILLVIEYTVHFNEDQEDPDRKTISLVLLGVVICLRLGVLVIGFFDYSSEFIAYGSVLAAFHFLVAIVVFSLSYWDFWLYKSGLKETIKSWNHITNREFL